MSLPSTPSRINSPSRVPPALLFIYALIWIALGIAPHYRQDWLLENVLVAIAVPMLIVGYRRLRFTNAAYVAIFVFLLLHAIGAHYTYSEVPYDAWAQRLFGLPIDELFGFERNHYDRAVHFLYGALITPAIAELLAAVSAPRGAWRWLLPLSTVMSHSVIYELIEWAAAIVFGGELGEAYLGTQGDSWDAQKDMLLATLGSAIAVAMLALRSRRVARFVSANP